ncbi:MAG: hypothetical protein KAJ36_03860 [Candidatus Thorarchaeota archaeon]|nr:hypothetical protein [Candidatus Thorarchaeota archaeon]
MNSNFEEDNNNNEQSEEQDIDWLDYAQQEQQALRPLDRTDYLALFIASLQTVLLPLVILIILLFAVNLWLQIMVG